MDILSRARPMEHGGGEVLAIDDKALMDWAEENGLVSWKAPIEALRRDVVPSRYLRNFWSLGFAEQARVCAGKVLVCGCGGLGGIMVELLARCGVGRLRLVDMDVFSESNLNRQLLCVPASIGVSKVRVASDRVAAINPFVSVDPFPHGLDEKTAGDVLAGVDLVMDAMDNIEGRFILASAARSLEIPFIHAAAAGWWGQISTFLPGSAHDLGAIYGSTRARDRAEEAAGVPGPVPNTLGSLAALEAVRILTGKEAAYSDKMLYFDGESGTFALVPLR